MKRTLLAVMVALALVSASCGSSTDEPTTTLSDSLDVTTSTATDSGASDLPDGEPARDFTLALGADQAEQFVLSQEAKPVFMVFWAEW